MRVLVVTTPLLEYAYPLVPLALELRTAGHQVLVATAGEALRVADSGLPVADVARRFDPGRLRRRIALRNPLLQWRERTRWADPRGVVTIFGEINDELADGVVTLADDWRPDLVLHDALAPVGALAAARRRVPAVLCDPTFYDGQRLSFATTGHLSYACGRHGITTPAPPSAVIRLAPPSMVGERPGWRMRYVPYDGGLAGVDWRDEPAVRPRIVVIGGHPAGPEPALTRRVLRAARRVETAEFLLVRPDLPIGPPLPEHIRTVEWTPLTRLLTTAAAVVHHGAAATVLTALVHGVPQLVVPDTATRRHNADLVYRRGVGLVAARGEISPALLQRLVDQASFTAAAAEVRVELATAPSPAEIAAKLTDLVATSGQV
ncbi:MAG TPA: nucleotide disphospho-sugar-binding domain-containing protein [Natronosporangium sp.]|nr:nucleotide disphospho-sugar-binding domain-containing protein [Natronosporangium sp.]